MINKVISYYRFTPLADPDAVRLWQTELCIRLGISGRIILATQGINGTVGGEVDAVKQYLKATRQHSAFAGLEAKWGDGTGEDFPRLQVKVRPELVTFGAAEEITVDAGGVVGAGAHLSPGELHALVAERDDVVFLDGRNAWEAEVGRFAGAVVTNAETTADFVAELESGAYDHLKDKTVVTYCTGGIRCEVLSSLMINRGFGEVYQVDGGILRYGEEFGDDGLWQGAVRVFDGREVVTFSDHAAVIGRCDRCGAPTSRHVDCGSVGCKGRSLRCAECAAVDDHCAAAHPADVVSGEQPAR